MRDHELELIAALVEGRLDDESEARALIDSSPELREEYEAQKLAYETLQEVGAAFLSEQESAALRRDVWGAWRAGAAPKRARSPWYYRWLPVAAGLFVVVGLVSVLSQVGGGDDASEETMRLADAPVEATTSTAAATGEVDEDTDGGAAPAADGAQTDTTSMAEEGGDSDFQSGDDGAEEAESAQYADEAEMVRQGDLSGGGLESFEASETRSAQAARCLETLGIDDYEIVATLPESSGDATSGTTTATADETTPLLVAIPDAGVTATAPVAFIDVEDCELVYLDQ